MLFTKTKIDYCKVYLINEEKIMLTRNKFNDQNCVLNNKIYSVYSTEYNLQVFN